jgi:hypothetical protein
MVKYIVPFILLTYISVAADVWRCDNGMYTSNPSAAANCHALSNRVERSPDGSKRINAAAPSATDPEVKENPRISGTLALDLKTMGKNPMSNAVAFKGTAAGAGSEPGEVAPNVYTDFINSTFNCLSATLDNPETGPSQDTCNLEGLIKQLEEAHAGQR